MIIIYWRKSCITFVPSYIINKVLLLLVGPLSVPSPLVVTQSRSLENAFLDNAPKRPQNTPWIFAHRTPLNVKYVVQIWRQ